MAAAALGFAARKIGGHALRQTQETVVSRLSPAVELGQRQLVPRFIHTEVRTFTPRSIDCFWPLACTYGSLIDGLAMLALAAKAVET